MRKEIHKKKVGELLHKIAEIEINLDIKKIECSDLEEENETLKDKIEFLTNCLDDRDKSIELLKEELEIYKKQYKHTMGEDS